MKAFIKYIVFNALICLLPLVAKSQVSGYSLSVDQNKVISVYDKPMLLGINACVYYQENYLINHSFINHLRDLNPGIMRMPGGTWSNEYYWNGNMVRLSQESYIEKNIWDSTVMIGGNPIEVAFDTARYNEKKWAVDYSGYAPGFRIKDLEQNLSDFHGYTDVLFLHEFIKSFSAETMVTVNVGTGTIEMAVEWVKWVKQRECYAKEPFDVKYWELGNELDGDWELGHVLPDGTHMDAKEYISRYKKFTTAMKNADPSIKVGGSVASSMELVFIEELIKDNDAIIDFISFHAYPSPDDETDFIKMADYAARVNDAVSRINGWIEKYRPSQKKSIKIAITEWNIKVKEDITTVDILNALWSAVMIGEMAKAGVDIAISWDMFSTTNTGGHGLVNPEDPDMKPRSQYWAMYLWNHYMGDEMVDINLNTPDYVRVYATKDDNDVSVMIINGSANSKIELALDIPEIVSETPGTEIFFSTELYEINQENLIPRRSEKPIEKKTVVNQKTKVLLPPQSIKVVRYPISS